MKISHIKLARTKTTAALTMFVLLYLTVLSKCRSRRRTSTTTNMSAKRVSVDSGVFSLALSKSRYLYFISSLTSVRAVSSAGMSECFLFISEFREMDSSVVYKVKINTVFYYYFFRYRHTTCTYVKVNMK